MIIWVEEKNHLLVGEADNGWPLYSYMALAPQNEEELNDLANFAKKYGYDIHLKDLETNSKENEEHSNTN